MGYKVLYTGREHVLLDVLGVTLLQGFIQDVPLRGGRQGAGWGGQHCRVEAGWGGEIGGGMSFFCWKFVPCYTGL